MSINTLFRKHFLLLILSAGFLARIFLIIFFHDHNLLFYDADSHEYIALAENIRLGHGFSWERTEPYYPNSFRTPIYPGFLFLARYLFGYYEAALIIQAFLISLSGYLLYLIGLEVFKNKTMAFLSVGIFLFTPFSLNVSVKFLTQTLFAFLLILAVWGWIKFLKYQDKKYFVLTSFLLPILALTRPIAQYIPAIFLLSLAYAVRLDQIKLSLGRFFKLAGLMMAIFFMVLSPWMARNYKFFKVFAVSSIMPYQLYFYELPDTYALAKGISYQEAGNILKQEIDNYSKAGNFSYYMEFAAGDVLLERSGHYLFQYPAYAAVSRIKNSVKFFLRDGVRYWYNDFNRSKRTDIDVYKILTLKEKNPFSYLVALERLFWGVLFLGMLISFFYLFKEDKTVRLLLSLLVLLLFYFSFLTGIMASAGLRFPVEPFFILVGLGGIDKLIHCVRGSLQK